MTTPSAEITEGYTDTLLSFHIFFYVHGHVFVFRNFLCLSFRIVMGQGNSYIIKRTVSFSASTRLYHVCWNLRSHQLWHTCANIKSCYLIPAPFLACIYSTAEYFYWVVYTVWPSVCELFLPAGFVSGYANSYSYEHPAITCSVVSPTLSHFLHVGHFHS